MSKYGEAKHTGSVGAGNPKPASEKGNEQVRHDTTGWSAKKGPGISAAAVKHAKSVK